MIRKLLKYKLIRFLIAAHVIALLGGVVFFFSLRHQNASDFEEALENTPYDVIIVPGLPFRDSTYVELMKHRVYWSKYLYEKKLANNIIYSGSAVYSPFIESEIMKQFGVAIGIPEEHIYTETKAEHSVENLYYSCQLAREHGWNNIALATDPFQSYLLTFFAEDQDMNINYLPIRYNLLEQMPMHNVNLDTSHAYVQNFVPLPEREGFLERFKGTLGKHINYIEKR